MVLNAYDVMLHAIFGVRFPMMLEVAISFSVWFKCSHQQTTFKPLPGCTVGKLHKFIAAHNICPRKHMFLVVYLCLQGLFRTP
jgi:hypothetical protein